MNKQKIKISVLIPTYQRPLKLQKCLEHLTVQTRAADEIIVVVRPEDISSIEVIEKFQKLHVQIKQVFSYETGVIAAENAGIKEIKNDLVAFIDDDGYAPTSWLSDIELFFISHPNASALGGSDIIMSDPASYHNFLVEEVGLVTWYGKVIGNHHRKSQGPVRRAKVLKGVNMIIRRDRLPFLDERLAGRDGTLGNGSQWELDICLNIENTFGEIYFMPNLIVNHDSDHSTHNLIISSHNLAYVMFKHLSPVKKYFFLFYALIIGNTQLPGIIKALSDIFKNPSKETFQIVLAKMIGFYQGIKTYLRRSK